MEVVIIIINTENDDDDDEDELNSNSVTQSSILHRHAPWLPINFISENVYWLAHIIIASFL